MATRPGFPIPLSTLERVRRPADVIETSLVWSFDSYNEHDAFASLSFTAAELGAAEVVGVRISRCVNGTHWSVVAYGTAVYYS
jgi:hypothetical protein